MENLRKELEKAFEKEGLTQNTLKMSMELDVYIAKEQRRRLNEQYITCR